MLRKCFKTKSSRAFTCLDNFKICHFLLFKYVIFISIFLKISFSFSLLKITIAKLSTSPRKKGFCLEPLMAKQGKLGLFSLPLCRITYLSEHKEQADIAHSLVGNLEPTGPRINVHMNFWTFFEIYYIYNYVYMYQAFFGGGHWPASKSWHGELLLVLNAEPSLVSFLASAFNLK